MGAVEANHGIPLSRLLCVNGKEGEMNRFLQLFLHYGLVAAIFVWAATVALMAYHLKESPWRWVFMVLSLAGLGTIGIIFGIRKYINRISRGQQEVGKAQ
jgi:hypothetical protein